MNINDALMRKVKQTAAKSGRTITQVVEDSLRNEISEARPEEKPFELKWITVTGKLNPGVDLADRDALTELMEGRS